MIYVFVAIFCGVAVSQYLGLADLGGEVVMAWAFVGVYLFLLCVFPRTVIAFTLIGVLMVGLWLLSTQQEASKREADRLLREKSVKISVVYDTAACGEKLPLRTVITNGILNPTLKNVAWNLAARRPGYSSNIVDYGLYTSIYDHHYKTDKILKPGESTEYCFSLPKFKKPLVKSSQGSHPRSFSYEVISKVVEFYK